jgi:hypothetical protein
MQGLPAHMPPRLTKAVGAVGDRLSPLFPARAIACRGPRQAWACLCRAAARNAQSAGCRAFAMPVSTQRKNPARVHTRMWRVKRYRVLLDLGGEGAYTDTHRDATTVLITPPGATTPRGHFLRGREVATVGSGGRRQVRLSTPEQFYEPIPGTIGSQANYIVPAPQPADLLSAVSREQTSIQSVDRSAALSCMKTYAALR